MSTHPDITRTAVTRRCEACEGGGVLVVNDTDPHGYGPDPQCDEEVDCEACEGTGQVTTWTDPLLAMADLRLAWRYWPGRIAEPQRRMAYGEMRQRAVSPVCLPDAPVAFRLEKAA